MKALFKTSLRHIKENEGVDKPLYAHVDIGNGEKIMLICYKGTVERFNEHLGLRRMKE